jgi:hypothetical protein
MKTDIEYKLKLKLLDITRDILKKEIELKYEER